MGRCSRTRQHAAVLVLGSLLCAWAAPPPSETSADVAHDKNARKPHALFAWGRNNAGQLGLGHSAEVSEPQILSAFAGKEIKHIAAGGAYEDDTNGGFSLVVSSAGHLYTFGSNMHGQLGVSDRIDRSSLVPVGFLLSGKVTQVAAGATFSVAVTDSGQLFTWGSNEFGQLGVGDLRDRLSPELVAGELTGKFVTVVMAGDAHVVALTRDGTLFTWGSNAKSQLGVGKHVVRQATPTHLQGAITGIQFVGVATGGTHTLAVSRSGEVYCWGNNDHGQLGLGDLEERSTPHAILHKFTRSKITRVAAGAKHSLALTSEGDLFSWGGNKCGQLGYEVKGGRKFVGYPRRVETIRAKAIRAGAEASIAILPTGKVFVWGCNTNGELGQGDVSQRTTPHMLTLPGSGSLREFQDISGGGNHMLALNKRSELFAWGRNTRGQLGLAYHTQAELKPLLVASAASTTVTHLATGGYAYEYQAHSMALTADGKLYTWGWNAFGQLGLGTVDQGVPSPTRLFALEAPYSVVALACGQYNSVVAAERKKGVHSVFAWGPNTNGQLGHKFLELGPVTAPSKIDALKGHTILMVRMGYSHTLALTTLGEVFVWGNNAHGQLGTGDSKERAKPTQVTLFRASAVVVVAAGQQSSYALNAEGAVFAWGYNANFELGLGEPTHRNSPQVIKALAGHNVTWLTAGGYHAVALTAEGGMFSWGLNDYGQLGLGGGVKVAKEPTRVGGLPPVLQPDGGGKRKQLESVSAGTWHTAAVTVGGAVYTWGRGSFGQLGHAGLADVAVPTLVQRLQDSAAVGVAAGAAHTMAVATPGKSWQM